MRFYILCSFSGYIGFGGKSSMPGLFRSLCDRVNTKEQLADVSYDCAIVFTVCIRRTIS